MKAVVTTGPALRPRLTLGEVADPGEPGADDVVVKVHAASVNPKDWKLNYNIARLATPLMANRLAPLFGDDLAGTVVTRGGNVTDLQIGDAVYGMDMRLRTASLAEYALIARKRIARKPESLSFGQAASMPLAAQTALQGLRKGRAGKGSRVLIIGASGGVGTFAVQIARAQGMHVTGVCSGRNADLVRELGAHEVIDYTAGDYRKSAGPFDMIFDVTSHESPRKCAAMMGPDAWFISTGGDFRSMLGTPFYRVFGKNAAGVVVASYTRDLESLASMVDKGELKPVIDSEFDLADSEQAYRRSRTGRCRGKVVIRVMRE
ncbi:MAG: NAD(P)-dependent alcohol dehydrogenase [Thermodesulfobacteriota bacterium]